MEHGQAILIHHRRERNKYRRLKAIIVPLQIIYEEHLT